MFFHSDTLFSRETTLFNGLTWVTWSTQSHSPPHWRSPAPNDTIRNTHIHSDCQLFYDDRKHCQSVVLEERRKVVEPWKTRCAKHKQCAVPCQRASMFVEFVCWVAQWHIKLKYSSTIEIAKGLPMANAKHDIAMRIRVKTILRNKPIKWPYILCGKACLELLIMEHPWHCTLDKITRNTRSSQKPCMIKIHFSHKSWRLLAFEKFC